MVALGDGSTCLHHLDVYWLGLQNEVYLAIACIYGHAHALLLDRSGPTGWELMALDWLSTMQSWLYIAVGAGGELQGKPSEL